MPIDPVVVGAVGGIGYLIWRRFFKKKGITAPPGPPPLPTPPTPTPEPGPKPSGIPSGVIGGGWDWPEKGTWPSQGAVGHSLWFLGCGYPLGEGFQYGGYKITEHKNGVKAFQKDWNVVVPYWGTFFAHLTKPVGKLSVDGWVGPNTWKAMRKVFKNTKGDPGWCEIVDAAQEMKDAGMAPTGGS